MTTDDDRAEAERLKLLPIDEQRQTVEAIRCVSDNPKVSKADREEAARRAKALKRLLKLPGKKKGDSYQ